MESTNYLIVEIGFSALTIIYFWLLLREFKRGLAKTNIPAEKQKSTIRNITLALITWTIVLAVLSFTGFIRDFSTIPPRQFIMLIIPLASVIWFMNTAAFKEMIRQIPIGNLTRLQSFRFFVEIFLWMLFIENLLPEQMTLEGRNFDILSGITAPFAAWFFRNNRRFMIGWNIICLLLLVNILVISILSMPTPFRVFMNEPANTIVTYFPIILLPGLLVPLAYSLHFFSLKKLLMK